MEGLGVSFRCAPDVFATVRSTVAVFEPCAAGLVLVEVVMVIEGSKQILCAIAVLLVVSTSLNIFIATMQRLAFLHQALMIERVAGLQKRLESVEHKTCTRTTTQQECP
jgi:ABC-type uncharacterized transport system fused permease/ATPase subunit